MEKNITNQSVNHTEIATQTSSNPIDHSKRNILIILGTLFLLLVVGGGSYYLGAQKNRTTSKSQNINTQSTEDFQNTQVGLTNTPISTQTSSDTENTNWKTYTDTKNKFSIKYPPGWTEKGPVENDTTVYLNADEFFGEGTEPIYYFVWIYSDSKLPSVKLTKESLGAYTIYKTDELPSQMGALNAFITQDEKKYIGISITPYNIMEPFISQDKYIGIFNKMLSTFKFTN